MTLRVIGHAPLPYLVFWLCLPWRWVVEGFRLSWAISRQQIGILTKFTVTRYSRCRLQRICTTQTLQTHLQGRQSHQTRYAAESFPGHRNEKVLLPLLSLRTRGKRELGSTNPHVYDQIQWLLKIPQYVLPNAFRRFYSSEKIRVSGRNRSYWGPSWQSGHNSIM